ncbi:homoserine O-acetyltransferase/O-succinyltransferase family protein [Streptomyces sp. enrichment culture]|uniref:homoserine O-acetyltransferase/O-succinyltransferase family protein n=1 Tax=Streptomyces sp. enrichment culture TaxID=1795815 RepID=UPI003F57A2AB
MRPLRIGIADLFSPAPDSWARYMFASAVEGAAARLGLAVEVTAYGADLSRPAADCGIAWAELPGLDGLVVTGGEPRHHAVAAEPALAVVDRVLTATADRVVSTVYSCQSAHAALHLLHGLERSRLPHKRHGVFGHRVRADGPLTAGLPERVLVPHSRWNTMPAERLRRAGVTVALETDDGDWSLATGDDGLRHVFSQGHPEYLRDTLLSEYRRDLRRYAAGEAPHLPDPPRGCLTADAREALLTFAGKLREQRDPGLLGSFPDRAAADGVDDRWLADSRAFFTNWLTALDDSTERRLEHRADLVLARRRAGR